MNLNEYIWADGWMIYVVPKKRKPQVQHGSDVCVDYSGRFLVFCHAILTKSAHCTKDYRTNKMFIIARLMPHALVLELQRLGLPQTPAIPGNRYIKFMLLCIHSIQFQLHRIVRFWLSTIGICESILLCFCPYHRVIVMSYHLSESYVVLYLLYMSM